MSARQSERFANPTPHECLVAHSSKSCDDLTREHVHYIAVLEARSWLMLRASFPRFLNDLNTRPGRVIPKRIMPTKTSLMTEYVPESERGICAGYAEIARNAADRGIPVQAMFFDQNGHSQGCKSFRWRTDRPPSI